MAKIAAVRGIRYNASKVPDLSKVITQPYDKIDSALQDKYYDLHPYNMARIIKGKEFPEDTPENNVYTRARDYYRRWQADGHLMRESQPALYVYHQTFTVPDGRELTRKAFITAFELAEFSEGVVLPHERTLSGPKADRLNLFRATSISFEQVFILYPDSGNRINSLLDSAVAGKAPDADVRETLEKDVRQKMWVVTDPAVIAAVVAEMAPKRGLIIADGHHRYETALNYQAEMREKHPDAPANAAFNYCTATMVSMDDPGLTILPTHRLIYSYTAKTPAQILAGAAEYFDVTPVAGRAAFDAAMAQATPTDKRIGVYDGSYSVLRVKGPEVMARVVPERAAEWRALDVSILHELIIERVMGLSKASVEAKENIEYYRDLEPALAEVDAGRAQCVFILNPTRIEEVKACSEKGEKMPQKSTDFYPKVITGFVTMPVNAEERL